MPCTSTWRLERDGTSQRLVLPSDNKLGLGGIRVLLASAWRASSTHPSTKIPSPWCDRRTPTNRGTGESNGSSTRTTYLVDRTWSMLPNPAGNRSLPPVTNGYLLKAVATRNTISWITARIAGGSIQRIRVCGQRRLFQRQSRSGGVDY